jgi:hypothetical protein
MGLLQADRYAFMAHLREFSGKIKAMPAKRQTKPAGQAPSAPRSIVSRETSARGVSRGQPKSTESIGKGLVAIDCDIIARPAEWWERPPVIVKGPQIVRLMGRMACRNARAARLVLAKFEEFRKQLDGLKLE